MVLFILKVRQYVKIKDLNPKVGCGGGGAGWGWDGGVLVCKKVGRGRRKICNLYRRPIWACLDLFVLSETKIRDLCH